MLPVSNDYLVDMAKLIRNYSDVFVLIPLGKKKNSGNVSMIGFLPMDISVVDVFSPITSLTDYGQTTETADENGEFSVNPSITVEMQTPGSIDGLSVQFGDTADYAVRSFQVTITHSDNTTESYDYDIDSSLLASGIFTITQEFDDVESVTFTITKANPNSKARMYAVSLRPMFAFDNKTISTVDTETEIDQISRRLPTETCSFVVLDYDGQFDPDNPDGVWKYFEEKQPFSVQYGYLLDDGTWEWLNKTNYVLTGSPQKNGFDVTFSGTKLLATLTGTYRQGVYNSGGQSLYMLARSVLLDAGVSVMSGLDAALLSINTTAPLPVATHAECLQLIAQAGNCLLYTGSDGRICIKSGWYPSSLLGNETIDYETQLKFPVIDITPPLKVETVKQYRYVPKVASETLVDQTMDIVGTASVWIDYDLSTGQSATVSGGTLVSVQYYGRCAYLTITASGTVTVQITGKPIVSYSSSADYEIGSTGDVDTFDNQLIDNSVLQYEVAQYRANYLKNRNAYTLNYRGNPELECSDVVGFETEYADNLVGVVVSTKISYNGALGGELILKKLDSYLDYYYADSELYTGENVGVI